MTIDNLTQTKHIDGRPLAFYEYWALVVGSMNERPPPIPTFAFYVDRFGTTLGSAPIPCN